jgi:porin
MQARRSRDLRRTHQTQKHSKSRARQCVQSIGRIVLCLCFLAAIYAARPGFAQTAQTAPAAPPAAPTPPATTLTTNPPAQRAPPPGAELSLVPATTPLIPAITPETNPAVISPPQAQLDYNLQIPLFGELPLRKELSEKGIDFIAHYISDTASNTAGIHGTATAYAQQVDFGIGFNLDKLGVWSDAVAHFAMTDRAGRSLTDDRTGGYFPYQVIFGQGQNLRFNEISVEKFLFDKELALKVGFYPMGNDFAVLPYLCNFTNDALCGHPITLFDNSAWADAPAGRWTGRVQWHITDELQFQTAVVDANPTITQRQHGFKLNFSGNTGVIVPAELKYQIGKNPSDLGGTYNLGGYYDTSARADLANPKIFHEGLYGLYVEAAQQIIKWGPDHLRGLALFGVFTVSDQNTAKFKYDYEAGFAARGVVPDRPLDLLSLGWVRTDINPRFQFQLEKAGLPIQTSEQLVELNYAFQLTPSLFFRPGVQYDIRPGATSTHPNTWVFAFHIQLTL